MYSKTKDDYQSVLGSAEWSDIQDRYLQIPDSDSLPTTGYVHDLGSVSIQDYEDWAPWVVENTTSSCSYPGQTVFSEANTEMQRIAPNYFINTNEDVVTQLGIAANSDPMVIPNSPGAFGLVFDFDMWFGEYSAVAHLASDYEMPHPEPYEDYNE